MKPTLYEIKLKGEPIVSKTRVTITIYENVRLRDSLSGEYKNSQRSIPTGLRRPWIIRME